MVGDAEEAAEDGADQAAGGSRRLGCRERVGGAAGDPRLDSGEGEGSLLLLVFFLFLLMMKTIDHHCRGGRGSGKCCG